MTSAKNIKNIVFDSIIRVVTKMPLALRDTVLDLRTSFPSRKAHHKVIPLYNEDEGLNSEIKDAVVDKNGEIILGDNIVRCWIEGKHQIKDLRRVDYVRLNDSLLVKNEGLFLDNHLMIEFTPTERTELMYIDYKEHKKARENYYSFRTNSRLFVSNDLISWKLIYAGKRGIKNSMVFVERSEKTYLIFIEYTPGEVRERHKIIEYCFESEQISVSKEFYTCKEFLQDNSLPCCRHIHVIDKDPFTGNIYVGTGDNDFESAIWVSNDQGITYKKLYQDGQLSRTLSFFFSKNKIFWTMDSHEPQFIISYERDTGNVEKFPIVNGALWHSFRVFIDGSFIYVLGSNSEGAHYDNNNRVYGIIIKDETPCVYELSKSRSYSQYNQMFPIYVYNKEVYLFDILGSCIRKGKLELK